MAKIPIRKLKTGTQSYYPLSVGEATVITHNITVKGNIGNYKKGDVVPAVTSFDKIITNLLSGGGGGGGEDISIDNKLIVKNQNDEITVPIDDESIVYDEQSKKMKSVIPGNVARTNEKFNFEKEIGFKNSITIVNSEFDAGDASISRVVDPTTSATSQTPDNVRYKKPVIDGIVWQTLGTNTVDIGSGNYRVDSNRTTGIVVTAGEVNLYIPAGVSINCTDSDGIYVKTGAVVNLFLEGSINIQTEGSYCAIYNEGSIKIVGSNTLIPANSIISATPVSYQDGDETKYKTYYTILNHGELCELWDVKVITGLGSASMIVNGYYNYVYGNGRSYINETEGNVNPFMVLHSGNYEGNISTGTLKNDGGGTLEIYGGHYISSGGQVLQNSGVQTSIHGGTFEKKSTAPQRLIWDGSEGYTETPNSRNSRLIITGGTFNTNDDTVYWLWIAPTNNDIVYPIISGGVFGPVTRYVVNGSYSTEFHKLAAEGYITLKDAETAQYGVYNYSSIEDKLNSVFFQGGQISSVEDGIIITGLKDVNIKSSPVTRGYLDGAIAESSMRAFKQYLITHNEYTAFEVYATSSAIAAGTVDPITNLEYKVQVPACHGVMLTIRTMNDRKDQNVIIDWGDGSFSDLANDAVADTKPTNTSENRIWWPAWDSNEGEYNVNITHNYTANGRYIVKIWGNTYWGIRCETQVTVKNSNNTTTTYNIPNIVSRIFEKDLPVNPCCVNMSSMCKNALKLQKIFCPTYYQGVQQIQNSSSMFSGCANLLTVKGFAKYSFPYHVTAYGSIFMGCTNMTTCDMRLAQSRNRNGSEGGVFKNCSSLAVELKTLLPANGFSDRVVSMNEVFRGCANLKVTNTNDWVFISQILWDDDTRIWQNTSNCFTDCSAELREWIPETWGGTQYRPFVGREFTITNYDDIVTILREACERVHLSNYSFDTDDDVKDVIERLMANAKITHVLDTDDDMLAAMKELLIRFGASNVIVNG